MDIYIYTALLNRYGASELVREYGMVPANNPRDLASQLAQIVARYREEGLNKLAAIHPDLELFQERINEIKQGYQKDKESFMEKHFSNMNGQSIKNDISDIRDKKDSSKDLLIVGGLVVVALAIVMRK